MKYYIERFLSILAAILFLQTLYFKFTAAPESVYIFSKLGIEPYGRIGTGVLELIVSSLLLFRKTSLIGAIVGVAIILGAIFLHLFVLGIEVQNDGGFLFGLAVVIFISCLISIWVQKEKVGILIKKMKKN